MIKKPTCAQFMRDVMEPSTKLDAIDIRIIEVLRHNARLSNVEIGMKVGLSASACGRRIRGLENAGVIRGYTTVINTAASEARRPVFLQMKLVNPTQDSLNRFEQAVRKCPEVRECFCVSGAADYLLRIEVSDFEDFERVHSDVLTRLPGVGSIVSSFTIRNVFSYQK